MATAVQGRQHDVPASELVPGARESAELLNLVTGWLDEAKAAQVVTIDLSDKSVMADFMIIATGGNERHVAAIADQLQRRFKEIGHGRVRVEGLESCDWVLIDTGDIVIHVFRPEVREFYNLERMWSQDRPSDQPH